ncbi:uncharacterized protein LOC113214356 [Frankliniella occidentalis]|uniref:Uncharacterized protein LOC113214356 n=1 Tax=Frankliniella occidentalis TaxID=133901 RepID=A0A9C6X380_FRAOC|nr:uncharacterized protein LOC113214356 [Frankliniella occidentalis]
MPLNTSFSSSDSREKSPKKRPGRSKFTVSPLIVKRTKRNKTTSNQSSHDYNVRTQISNINGNPNNEARSGQQTLPSVPPVVIQRKRREKTTSNQSSHDYNVRTQISSINCNTNNAARTVQQSVPPVVIQRARREKTASNQSSHDYNVRSQINNIDNKKESSFVLLSPAHLGKVSEFADVLDPPEEKTFYFVEEGDPAGSNLFGDDIPEEGQSDREPSFPPASTQDTDGDKSMSMFGENNLENVGGAECSAREPTSSLADQPVRTAFFPVVLTEDDGVPGARLPRQPLAANTNKMLKRWLECRGKPTGGRREELLERVALLKALPNSHILDVKVDKGYWYERKCETLRAQQVHQIVNSQALPSTQVHQYPTEGWKPFPSVDMPVMFNYGHIYFYLVESIPSLPQSDESDEDCEDIPESSRIQDPFDDEHKSLQDVKTLRKGLRFFKSKYVRNVHDVCEAGRTYFVKAEVRASMEAVCPLKTFLKIAFEVP